MTTETNPVDDYAEKMRRNPYAFPMGNPTHGGYDGMTLRDYFAGQALAGLCANISIIDGDHAKQAEMAVSFAGYLADAMLTARKGPDHGRG